MILKASMRWIQTLRKLSAQQENFDGEALVEVLVTEVETQIKCPEEMLTIQKRNLLSLLLTKM